MLYKDHFHKINKFNVIRIFSTFVKYPYEIAMTEFTAVELKNYFNIFKKIVNSYQQNNAMIRNKCSST